MQGLIALFEDEYFVVTKSGYLVVDLTAWGWIMLIWGVLLVLAGLGLLSPRRGGPGGSRSSLCAAELLPSSASSATASIRSGR